MRYLTYSWWIRTVYTHITPRTKPSNQHRHLDFKKRGFVMWPSDSGQLNTSHWGWYYSKGSLTLLTNHQPHSEKLSSHWLISNGQCRSTPTQVTENWIAWENVVCLSTWKTFVYSHLVTWPDRFYQLKNKYKDDAKCSFLEWKIYSLAHIYIHAYMQAQMQLYVKKNHN